MNAYTSGNHAPVVEVQLVGVPREPRIALMVDRSRTGRTIDADIVSAMRWVIEGDRRDWYVIFDMDTLTHGVMSPAEMSLFLDFLLLFYGVAV